MYHYGLRNHELEQIRTGDLREQIAAAALGQATCAKAPVVFAWTAIFARSTWKYGQRAYRYIYLDAGHIAENLALAAVSLDLGTCQIGALFDERSTSCSAWMASRRASSTCPSWASRRETNRLGKDRLRNLWMVLNCCSSCWL